MALSPAATRPAAAAGPLARQARPSVRSEDSPWHQRSSASSASPCRRRQPGAPARQLLLGLGLHVAGRTSGGCGPAASRFPAGSRSPARPCRGPASGRRMPLDLIAERDPTRAHRAACRCGAVREATRLALASLRVQPPLRPGGLRDQPDGPACVKRCSQSRSVMAVQVGVRTALAPAVPSGSCAIASPGPASSGRCRLRQRPYLGWTLHPSAPPPSGRTGSITIERCQSEHPFSHSGEISSDSATWPVV